MSVGGDPERTYVARRRHRRRLWLVGVATALLVIVVTVRRPDLADPCDTPERASGEQLALLPSGLSLDAVGTVTSVRTESPNIVVDAVSSRPLDEVALGIQDAVVAAGYRPGGIESDAFEAEVFFSAGAYAGGQARVQQSACAGRLDVDLVLLDLDAVTRE